MVRGIVFHTVEEEEPTLLLVKFFSTSYGALAPVGETPAAAVVARRAAADYRFRAACDEGAARVAAVEAATAASASTPLDALSPVSLAPTPTLTTTPSASEGVSRAPGGHVVVWRYALSLGAAVSLVLEPEESPALALSVLGFLCKFIAEHLSTRAPASPGPGAAIAARPDDILIILEHIMPGGLLILLSSSFEKHIRKEAENALRLAEAAK